MYSHSLQESEVGKYFQLSKILYVNSKFVIRVVVKRFQSARRVEIVKLGIWAHMDRD